MGQPGQAANLPQRGVRSTQLKPCRRQEYLSGDPCSGQLQRDLGRCRQAVFRVGERSGMNADSAHAAVFLQRKRVFNGVRDTVTANGLRGFGQALAIGVSDCQFDHDHLRRCAFLVAELCHLTVKPVSDTVHRFDQRRRFISQHPPALGNGLGEH